MTSDQHVGLPEEVAALRPRIDRVMLRDAPSLRRTEAGLRRLISQGKPFDRKLGRLERDLTAAEQRVAEREKRLPKVEYDDTLPIVASRSELAEAIRDNQVVVVCGETGSGKSTQLPKICLELGRGLRGMIGHTQPRRIAARSVGARVASELGVSLGQQVGFKIRFTDATSPHTLIKLMTDGVLLAESQSDRLLEGYDTIIIDEAHERSLNIDFLLGYLHRLLPKRPDLRVIVTSATIDAERFAEFFAQPDAEVPILHVSGRTYPVEVRYQPPAGDDDDEDDIDWQRAVADACEELAEEGPGDILVFMPTEREILEASRVLRGRTFRGDGPSRQTEILPLFGRLSEKEQNRVFQPHGHRRIVIATNVAESSLTVPGIRYVVDVGTARISRFSPTSKVQRLPIEPISQASADQRAGRCGRIGPGICVRLYSAEDYSTREQFTPAEIQRTNLASVLLQMKSLGLGAIQDFPWLDPPSPTAVRSGLKTLFELGAIDDDEELTPVGQSLSKLPVDPRLGRMIIAAADEQALPEVLIIASALELRDPRERPIDKQQAADAAHEKFADETSDFLSLLKLWDFYEKLDNELSQSRLRKACHQNFLSYNRLREWRDLHRQLSELVASRGYPKQDRRNIPDAIHRSILAGLLSNVAMRGESHEYTGAGGQKLFLWPGSAGFDKKPKWIMAAELVETSRRFARCIAPIQPTWIESLASHLVKRTYSEPHWHRPAAAAMAFEKVLLFGLPIVPRRRKRFSLIDRPKSREMFIEHALLVGDYDGRGPFLEHNQQLKTEIKEWQAKLRSGGLVWGDDEEFAFFDGRLPEDVTDGPSFEKWRKKAEAKDPRILFMSREDLLPETPAAPAQEDFPDAIRCGSLHVPVEYHLEPGEEHDGVMFIVPQEGLHQISEERLAWLVPGLLADKVAALIKTLPKAMRTMFVPAPETAAKIVEHLEFGKGDLLTVVAHALRRLSGEHVPVDSFDLTRLPSHLVANVRVIDASGNEVATARSLGDLRQQLREESASALNVASDGEWNQTGLRSWSFANLPEQVEVSRGTTRVVAYPMLTDESDSVALRLASTALEADRRTRRAMVRLFMLGNKKRLQEQVKHFPRIDQLAIQATPILPAGQFRAALQWRLAERCVFSRNELPRTLGAWNEREKLARNQIGVAVQDLANLVPSLLSAHRDVRRLLEARHPPALQPPLTDLRQQFQHLFTEGFLTDAPWPWLVQFPRYLEAIQLRWKRLTTGGFQKDQVNQKRVSRFWQRYLHRAAASDQVDWNPWLENYRWLIEEYRVSLFAQQLRTAVPVSEKRLEEVWQAANRS